ncbi:MAG: hypothetical protein K9I82_01155 [Chitinophagaceae bacterium]|nr:hypothetical protein [Chitinophagaceae bacterium]
MLPRVKTAVFIDFLNLEVDELSYSSVSAVLKDEDDKVMLNLDLNVPKGEKQIRWNGLNNLPYGIYSLELSNGEEISKIRLVKRV